MMDNKKICVIIPVHKDILNEFEKKSLIACSKHLSIYDCYLVIPEGVIADRYTEIFSGLMIKRVEKKWLSSIESYNKMKLSLPFYKMFSEYDFMLTYELDSYIFSNQWNKAKCFEYDFIGAPFMSKNSEFLKGFNSGFSMRKISSCIRILESINVFYRKWKIYNFIFKNRPMLKSIFDRITFGKNREFVFGYLDFYFLNKHVNEDVVWSQVIPIFFLDFKVSTFKDGLAFSFEYCPEYLFDKNSFELPIGCHAWDENMFFWEKYIF